MLQLLHSPNFDFMGKRWLLLPVSIALVLVAVAVLVIHGLNLGIEFTGGTEMQVRYADTPDIPAIRATLNDIGMKSQVVTTIGDPKENEVYIRLGMSEEEAADDPTSQVLLALRGLSDGNLDLGNDLNIADQTTLAGLLEGAPGLSTSGAAALAEEILALRKEQAIFHSIDELATLPGMTPEILDELKQDTVVGALAMRSQSYIGPAVGRELVKKAIIAIIGSLIGMLIYIWIRFQFQWGLAAVVALAHDTLITLGLFSLFNQEMSLPVVAAFLTLVGYSVNDTVVVFDRIRENLAARPGSGLTDIVNLSINQTLSRTIITSGLTWIVVLSLFIFGGSALRPFSFVLSAGVLVGTYSSIYVASPILVLWKAYLDRRKGKGAAEARSQTTRKTRKVRSSG